MGGRDGCRKRVSEIRVVKIVFEQHGRQTEYADVKKAVSVTEEDIKDFLYLAEHGVKVTAQMVPTDEAVDFTELIKEVK